MSATLSCRSAEGTSSLSVEGCRLDRLMPQRTRCGRQRRACCRCFWPLRARGRSRPRPRTIGEALGTGPPNPRHDVEEMARDHTQRRPEGKALGELKNPIVRSAIATMPRRLPQASAGAAECRVRLSGLISAPDTGPCGRAKCEPRDQLGRTRPSNPMVTSRGSGAPRRRTALATKARCWPATSSDLEGYAGGSTEPPSDGTPFMARGFERVPALDHLQGWLTQLMSA